MRNVPRTKLDSNAHCVHIMLALSHLYEVLVVLDDDVVLVELPVHVRLRPALRIQEDSISAWCNDAF